MKTMTQNHQDSITLFLTADRAHQAAHRWMNAHAGTRAAYSVVAATMRDHDGTVDHGFKVRIHDGAASRFL